jgi:hypothetical protein
MNTMTYNSSAVNTHNILTNNMGCEDVDGEIHQLLLPHLQGAARTVLDAAANHADRARASRYLEEWVATDSAWRGLGLWLQQQQFQGPRGGTGADNNFNLHRSAVAENEPVKLLCLQLLQSKARKSLPYLDPGNHQSPHSDGSGTTNSTPILDPNLQANLSFLLSILSQMLINSGSTSTSSSPQGAVEASACVALTAISVRSGRLQELFQHCVESLRAEPSSSAAHYLSARSAVKILGSVPAELESCALTPSRIAAIVSPMIPAYLEAVKSVLMRSLRTVLEISHARMHDRRTAATEMRAALKALARWIHTGHIPLSALNGPPPSQSEPNLLSLLAQLVSTVVPATGASAGSDDADNQHMWEGVVEGACEALVEAIQVPADACTDERQRALQMMLHTPGFIVAPLQFASATTTSTTTTTTITMSPDRLSNPSSLEGQDGEEESSCRWEDGSRALASLLCTIVCEHVDDWVTPGSPLNAPGSSPFGGDGLPSMLLWLQNHPLLAVRRQVLDAWLAVQDVPTAQRAELWKKPVFSRLQPALLVSCRYPAGYDSDGGGWDDTIVDESEWNEYRRLAADVLASAYFLLRGDYLDSCLRDMFASNQDADWRTVEVGLYGLVAVARDVCARVKSGGGSGGRNDINSSSELKSLVTIDRERTAHLLQVLMQRLCGGNPDASIAMLTRLHSRVLDATCDFLGAYSPAWRTLFDTPDAPMQLLAFLHRALSVQQAGTSAAKSIRSILIACSPLLVTADAIQLVSLFQHLLEAAVTIPDDETLSSIVEGCTRLLVQVKIDSVVSQGLAAILAPLVRSSSAAIQHLQSTASADPSMVAIEVLSRCLLGLQVLVQFCDGDSASPHMSEILNTVWPILEKASQYALSRTGPSAALDRVMSIHEQLLKTAPSPMAPHLESTIAQALGILERSRDSATLRYLCRAVEVYGASNANAFRNVLERVSSIVFATVTPDQYSAELAASYFDLCLRYFLYCPVALVECSQFPAILAFAVEAIATGEGERESTRAALNLLAQLFGHRKLVAVPVPSRQYLDDASSRIDEILLSLGGTVTARCVLALAGGGSQMLWPPSADCLFAVLSSHPAAIPTPDGSTVGRRWMEASRPPATDDALFRQVSSILFDLLADGPAKGKAKVRMLLTDFGRIQAGEMSADFLITYSYS